MRGGLEEGPGSSRTGNVSEWTDFVSGTEDGGIRHCRRVENGGNYSTLSLLLLALRLLPPLVLGERTEGQVSPVVQVPLELFPV